MLTAIVTASGIKMEADYVTKASGPFACPKCGDEVILRRGAVKVAHFAHKPPVTCDYGTGETEQHRILKKGIAETLRNQGAVNVELEKRLENQIADVYCETATGQKVAIEVQISKLSLDQIANRTFAYQRQGVYVLWLVPWHEKLDLSAYSPRQYERWLHALNYGRVYYVTTEFNVIPYHFGQYMIHVPATDYGGGYSKKSKRWVSPKRSPNNPKVCVLTCLDDYRFEFVRQARSVGSIAIPCCRILMDKLDPWW
jgi:competence protein CoiA